MNAIHDYLITKQKIREKMQQQGKVSSTQFMQMSFQMQHFRHKSLNVIWSYRFSMNMILTRKSIQMPGRGSINDVRWRWMQRG